MKQGLGLFVLKWLRFWARLQLKKYAPDIIGITGSAGKTSGRNAVKAILQDKYQLKVSYKANSESGIPLNILGIKPKDFSCLDWLRMMVLAPIKLLTNWQPYEILVVEMGVDSPQAPKNMEYLLTIVRPRTAIYLNALPVHTAYYADSDPVAAIATEKGKLIESLPENGLAILNRDDPRVWGFKAKTKAQVMSFGKNPGSDVVITSWRPEIKGTTFGFRAEETRAELSLPDLLPEHLGSTLAAALCVALDEDYSLPEGVELLAKNYRLPPGRATLLLGLNGSMILDSSYNASPQTMADMLALLAQVKAKRKLVLLGDMRELGAAGPEAHTEVIKLALTAAAKVFLVGPLMRQAMVAGAVWCTNANQAAEVIEPQLKSGDLLMVKGSQNTILLETAVEKLLAKAADKVKLCRRGPYWERQRARL
ncbi:hypothetical protein A2W24_04385 [Microgenomates group bacterium RBG_16_45_19]|nr:MAG: hypothetical protein A2W24_04385 [Microgenomates group bacterium RBG_16_45_19]